VTGVFQFFSWDPGQNVPGDTPHPVGGLAVPSTGTMPSWDKASSLIAKEGGMPCWPSLTILEDT